MSIMISANDITCEYGSENALVKAVDKTTLKLVQNRPTGIIGASGSGKSTLLHIMSGLLAPTTGEVIYDNVDIYKLKDAKRTVLRRRAFGFIFQAYHLLPGFTAIENIRLPLLLNGDKVDLEYEKYLCEMLQISNRLAHYPSELSGGQQQRVAIARALILRPKIIFADEPTGNLDSASKKEVFDLLINCVSAFESSLLMVTHDESIAERVGTLYRMEDGKLFIEKEEIGTP